MKSTTGEHYLGLDHIRAFAALLVFQWHFLHGYVGYPVPFTSNVSVFLFPLALVDEGHVGVSLFMTLSGYLFAKLISDKEIYFAKFLYNRFIRLIPLLYLFLFIDFLHLSHGANVITFIPIILAGIYSPSYHIGGWSVMIEMQFYILLPLLINVFKNNSNNLMIILFFTIIIRILIYLRTGETSNISYWYLIGRIDQFIFGIFAYKYKNIIQFKKLIVLLIFSFCLFYWFISQYAPYYQTPGVMSKNQIWIVLPTIEGAVFSIIIAYYDALNISGHSVVSRFIGTIGAYSYSIYLTHFFFVFSAADFINRNILRITNIYIAMMFGLLCFLLMMPIGYLIMVLIERPILRCRVNYIRVPKMQLL